MCLGVFSFSFCFWIRGVFLCLGFWLVVIAVVVVSIVVVKLFSLLGDTYGNE